MWTIRRPLEGDGLRLRALRLRALRDAREFFLETLEAAEALDAAAWEARVARYNQPGRQVLMVAERNTDHSWVAMAGALVDHESESDDFNLPDPPVAQGDRWAMVWGAWVERAHRGHGLADDLCAALYTWAADEAGVDWLGLHVRDCNSRAIRFYARQGFDIVARRSYPAHRVTALVMVRAIARACAGASLGAAPR
ncbi:GNAT family N-acetyltransferase [Nocardia sp. NPDC050793]|uniref:GNAT family N-acetyltransferase n=1 Tax=Nocardia sp. NPDC050793 TaxID=3155159 RepID=UPI0033DB313E